MLSRRSIALITSLEHPSRVSVEAMLRKAFPEFELQNFSTTAIIKHHRRWLLPNIAFVLREYGRRLARGTIDLRTAYAQTSYVVRQLRAQMRHELDPARHVFSFQLQSLYDTQVPGIPHYIYTDHSHLTNLSYACFERDLLRSEAWCLEERAAYHNATRVFTRSENVRQDLIQRYGLPPAQTVCVYAGANVEVDRQRLSRAEPLGQRRVLFVGNDWERKGGPVLVSAFAEVLRCIPDATLIIVGARPELNVANCQVLGPLPMQQVSEQYSQASIFCLPTLLEPFGISFLEAMAHRLPVIGTRIGAVPEMVVDGVTGLLVNPGDARQLAQALITLLSDPNRCRRFGQAGFEHVSSHYTWDAVGNRIRTQVMRDLQASGRIPISD